MDRPRCQAVFAAGYQQLIELSLLTKSRKKIEWLVSPRSSPRLWLGGALRTLGQGVKWLCVCMCARIELAPSSRVSPRMLGAHEPRATKHTGAIQTGLTFANLAAPRPLSGWRPLLYATLTLELNACERWLVVVVQHNNVQIDSLFISRQSSSISPGLGCHRCWL